MIWSDDDDDRLGIPTLGLAIVLFLLGVFMIGMFFGVATGRLPYAVEGPQELPLETNATPVTRVTTPTPEPVAPMSFVAILPPKIEHYWMCYEWRLLAGSVPLADGTQAGGCNPAYEQYGGGVSR